MTTETPECRCLNCGKLLDNACGANTNETPQPGFLTVCFLCGAVMMFADDMTLRGLTEQEMDAVSNSPATMEFLARATRTIRMMPKMN